MPTTATRLPTHPAATHSTGICKRERHSRLNGYLDDCATALFDHWLTNCSQRTTVGNIAEEILDYAKPNKSYVKLINSSDVTQGVFPNPEYVQNTGLKGHFKKRFKKHDVLYSEIRPRNHHYGYVLFDSDDWISTTRLMVIGNRSEMISSSLLYYYLKSQPVMDKFTLKTETRSGTFPQGKYTDMASIEIPYAPVANQLGVTCQIKAILDAIYSNQCENQHLALLRDTLLPKLMSGEIDVSKVDLTQTNQNL